MPCVPHIVVSVVVGWDRKAHHGLVYRRAQGRSLRHHAINDIIWRALLMAGGPSTRGPAGLFRTDGKRPDGATLVPWSAGNYLAWDATVVHTCAASYIGPGGESLSAEVRRFASHAYFPAGGYRDSRPTPEDHYLLDRRALCCPLLIGLYQSIRHCPAFRART